MSEAPHPRGLRDAAVVGLGQMGRGIARNLDRAGRLATAWDSSPEAMQRAELSPPSCSPGPARSSA
jgi:3-hydroxyisobutyrate dehydrogenase-like beta-hydroxyacid dehydrogenase